MLNKVLRSLFVLVLVSSSASADQTITAQETERYFYKGGKVLRYEGQFEYTFLLDLDKDTLTRTRVFDRFNQKVTPHEIVYHIEKQLLSHPTSSERYSLVPVLRAIGQADADTVELLSIEEHFVNIVSSSGDEMTISRCRRLK